MAYRRRQQTAATATSSSNFSSTSPSPISSYRHRSHEDFVDVDVDVDVDLDVDHSSNSTVLAAKAIRASSAAHRDSSLSSAYAFNHPSPAPSPSPSPSSSLSSKDPKPDHEYTSMNTLNESKKGFWSNLARKAKSIIEDDLAPPSPRQPPDSSAKAAHWSPHSTSEPKTPYSSRDSSRKAENPPTLQKGLSAISSSLNYIGNAVEEGFTLVENRTAGIIQETRKHIRKKPNSAAGQNQPTTTRSGSWQQPQMQTHKQSPHMETDQELQLKASRDVAMAMAAKAKLLLRELKTVKADFAFAKERCAQLEEENKILRENRERGENLEDDDLIRLQLETLLAEKARLAHENSVYARENRFLREVVEYHQLTMQDVVYFDEGSEEVTEVYPIKVVTNTHPVPIMSVPPEASFDTTLPLTRDILPHPVPPPALLEVPQTTGPHHSYSSTSTAIDTRKLPHPSV